MNDITRSRQLITRHDACRITREKLAQVVARRIESYLKELEVSGKRYRIFPD